MNPEGLKRAGIVVLSRSNLAAPERLEQLHRRVTRYAPRALIIPSATEPIGGMAWRVRSQL